MDKADKQKKAAEKGIAVMKSFDLSKGQSIPLGGSRLTVERITPHIKLRIGSLFREVRPNDTIQVGTERLHVDLHKASAVTFTPVAALQPVG